MCSNNRYKWCSICGAGKQTGRELLPPPVMHQISMTDEITAAFHDKFNPDIHDWNKSYLFHLLPQGCLQVYFWQTQGKDWKICFHAQA
jgi:hypothetical protein